MSGIIKAVLGPTNTGKTHYAIERMLSYTSGVMGFPLRLLAREVYDRVVRVKGLNQTALITGEERIIPEGARYFLCTVEAMPRHMQTDFVGIDEVQMAADPGRGHVFTEHLLGTRGRFETLFMGSDTMAPLIRKLVPDAEIVERPRLSTLSYAKPQKLRRLPRRSAVVAFSAAEVYGLAELIRRDKGGAAIVMGALSPRTRNAQVAMYQSGEVDYLVATDAIGMGLNLDVDHIAFADLVKFDGRTFRELTPAEAGQIAGRAGRFKRDGTFSTLGGGDVFDPLVVSQIEDHSFQPVKALLWRNTRLDFTSISRLIWSLERPTDVQGLSRQRDALDLSLLKEMAKLDDVSSIASTVDDVSLLWEVCQIPDFRKLGSNDHLSLIRKIYGDLTSHHAKIDEDLVARAVKRLDKLHGDIDTLADRLASVRVWTYISHRSEWLANADHWANETRKVEDRLSDALHDRLTQRFVDRRTAVLLKSMKQRGSLQVDIDKETGRVTVEGHEIGSLAGFSFTVDPGAARDDQKTLSAAAESGLRAEISRRSKLFANVGFKTLELDLSGGVHAPRLTLEGVPVFTLKPGGSILSLTASLLGQTLLTSEEEELVVRKAQEWLDARIAEKLEKLVALSKELNGDIEAPEGAQPLSGLARGIAYRLLENYGTLNRQEIDQDLRNLDQDARKGLRRFGVRFGATSLYIPHILKPHATELRLIMWALKEGLEEAPAMPTPGMVWVEPAEGAPATFYNLAGFVTTSRKAVRMDMIERLADAVRPLGSQGEWFPVTPEIMGLVGLSGEDFAAVMTTLGYGFETRKEAKQTVQPDAQEAPQEEAQEALQAETQPEIDTSAPEEAAPEGVAAEEAPAHESAPEETPAAEATPADVTPEEAPAEETSPEEAPTETSLANDESSAQTVNAETAPDASAELVDRLYFKWSPRRKANNKQGERKTSNRRGNADRGGNANGGRDQQDSRFKGKGPKNEKRGQGKGPRSGDQGRPANKKPKRAKEPDPDSPFAALAGLKASLSKK